jgi:hypothetical protein
MTPPPPREHGTLTVKGTRLRYRCALARDLLTILSVVPGADDLRDHAMPVTYHDPVSNRFRGYTPDIAVRLTDPVTGTTTDMIYAVQSRAQLRAGWASFKPAWRKVRAEARRRGAVARIITEREIHTPLFANLTALQRAAAVMPNDGFEETLIAPLMAYEVATPEIVLLAAFSDDATRVRALPHLWSLILQGRVQADLTRPITLTTPIWVAHEEAVTWSDPHSTVLRPLVRSPTERHGTVSRTRSISIPS